MEGNEEMNRKTSDKYKKTLEAFLKAYSEVLDGRKYSYSASLDEEITKLQREIPLISKIVDEVYGEALTEKRSRHFTFRDALRASLSATENYNYDLEEEYVKLILNESIGNITHGTIPAKEILPVLPIVDEDLRKRCSDLLSAPRCFDRVINQATQVLEARLRECVSHEKLVELLPQAKDHTGEKLVNRLLGPANPPVIISSEQSEREAFHKMVVGIIAYLRNPSHHFLDDSTERSLAWSVVGLVDSILSQLDNAYPIKS